MGIGISETVQGVVFCRWILGLQLHHCPHASVVSTREFSHGTYLHRTGPHNSCGQWYLQPKPMGLP